MIIDQLFTRPIFESQTDPITQFASNAHEEWRRNFDPTGTKPRIKKNSDGTEGDINVPFADLHPDWQKENLAAGHAAHHAVKHFGNDMEKAAEFIHRQWMKRNPKADYNAAQHVPYDDLSDDEKEKDRVHVRTMMRLMGHHPKQGVAEVAPPGAKAERMVKHIKQGYAKDGKLTPREKGIAFATAWKAHNAGRVEEGEYQDDYEDEETELCNGCYVRDKEDSSGEIFVMRGDPGDRRVRIEDRHGRGWNIAPYRLTVVDDSDPDIAAYFGDELDEAGVTEAAQGHTIEAHGVRGMDRRTWHKTFKNTDQMIAWAEKHDAEIIGTRDLEQARHHNLSPANKGVTEGSTTRGGFGGSASQAQHEIQWLKNKIETLKPLLAKKPSVARQIKDLERQIRERELAISYQKEGVAEGAPELLKKEMPTHRHAEKLLAQNGVSKDDPDYHHHLNNTIKYLRQFGNIDLINKSDEQGVAEGEIEQTKTGIRHRGHRYGSGEELPNGGGNRSGFPNPGKYARDLDHLDKNLTSKLDHSMGVTWPHGNKKQEIDESIDPLMMKLKRAMVQEGRVKELALDLKTMSDADFMKKYGKAKAAIRKEMKRVDEAQTNYTPQEMADILSGKKTQQQVDAERAQKSDDKTDDLVMRVDKQGRRVDKNGKLLPPPKTWTNPPINPPPGKMQQYEDLNEQDAAGQQFVGTGTSSNWQMSVDIAARNARIKAAQSIAGANNIPNGVQLPLGTKYGPQDTKSDGTGKYVSTYTITLPAPGQSAEPAPTAPGAALDSSPATSNMKGSMSTGAPAAVGPAAGNYMKVNELSTNKLAQYKTAAAKDAKAADQAGDFKRGDKRLSGMVQATKKQFDNDAKKVDESRAARRALMAQIVNGN